MDILQRGRIAWLATQAQPSNPAQIWPANSGEVCAEQQEYSKTKKWPYMEANCLPKPKHNIQKQNGAEMENKWG